MPAVQGRAAGFIATLYRVPTVITDKSEANIEAAIVTANEVIDVSSMGALSRERAIIDIPVYGQDVAGKLAGQADPGTFDFTVTLNLNDAQHVAIRDNTGRLESTFILRYEQSAANTTYAAFDGFLANASVTQAIDGAIAMECSVARSGDVTWIDNST